MTSSRGRSPFGPVQKWGPGFHQQNEHTPARGRRAQWRRWWHRITPPWVITLTPLLVIPVGLATSPPAEAYRALDTVTVSVVWTGQPDCIGAWEPFSGDAQQLQYGLICDDDQSAAVTYTPARRGDWIGVNPEIGGADYLSCAVTASGRIISQDFGTRGDGEEVTCLTRW